MGSLAERLGYRRDDRLVIASADLLGSCHAANLGVYDSLRSGLATTATLMIPCPWSRHAAREYRGEDVGVHLTLNSELEGYRWGPITHAPSLLDGDGGFPRTVDDVWDHADLDEVRRESRAQLERAVLWGFDVSHLSAHLNMMQPRPEFFDAALELAVDYALPLRLEGPEAERTAGFPFRRLAAEEGVVSPDHFRAIRGGARRSIERTIAELAPGVTEILFEPARDTPELRALDPDWPNRVDDLEMLTRDSGVRALLDRSGVVLVSYRELRAVQRKG